MTPEVDRKPSPALLGATLAAIVVMLMAAQFGTRVNIGDAFATLKSQQADTTSRSAAATDTVR